MAVRVGILTVGDLIYWGECEDECAPLAGEWLRAHLSGAEVELEALVQQRCNVIQSTLLFWTDEVGSDLIFTLGGTAPAPNDIAIQATCAVARRTDWGSPCVAAIRGRTLIVNLPGDAKATQTALEGISLHLLERYGKRL